MLFAQQLGLREVTPVPREARDDAMTPKLDTGRGSGLPTSSDASRTSLVWMSERPGFPRKWSTTSLKLRVKKL